MERLGPQENGACTGATSDTTFFPDLIAATHLIKASWPLGAEFFPSSSLVNLFDAYAEPIVTFIRNGADEGGQSVSRIGTKAPPEDAELCGALLLAADTLLGDRELAELRARIQPLVREAKRNASSFTASIFGQRAGVSLTLSRAAARRIHGQPCGSKLPEVQSSHQFRVEEIPALLPQVWFERHFGAIVGALPQVDWQMERLLRRGAALRLAELVSGEKWIECAKILSLPEGCARSVLNRLGSRLDEVALWPAFEYATEQVALDLDVALHRVNYRNRRQRLERWRLPLHDWLAMCEGLPRLEGRVAKADPQMGSIFVWTEVTQSEHIHCPVVTTLRSRGGDTRSLVKRAGTFMTDVREGATLRLQRRLYLYADRIATACDGPQGLSVSVSEVVCEETDSESVPRALDLAEEYRVALHGYCSGVYNARRHRSSRTSADTS
ncbi:hypothetical protein [Streptomyces sp. 3211]|uniref:hypothetical protein n=1 Tax=Streptomyces sp. 3211 TaxID=1964449 RepID=UPI00178F435C|nr:hypothetical protein [Streptomyces sp. 3211]